MKNGFWGLLFWCGIQSWAAPNHGNSPTSSSTPTCKERAKSFCDQLWKTHKGNLATPNGGIFLGRSPQSRLSQAERIDLQALVESGPHMPPGMRAATQSSLEKIAGVLKKENDSEAWYLDLQKAREEFTKSLQEVKGSGSLALQLYHAKYDNHPNLKRAEKAFKESVADMITAIQQENIPPAFKQKVITRLKGLKLNADFTTIIEMSMSDECLRNLVNAAFDQKNGIVVCAGFFNTSQNEEALRQIISHELGHAISPLFYSSNPSVEPLNSSILYLSEVGAPSCQQWENILKNFNTPHANEDLWPPALSNCLGRASKSRIDPEYQFLNSQIGAESGNTEFMRKHGLALCDKTRNAKWYLNPKQFIADNAAMLKQEGNMFIPNSEASNFFPEAFVFAQIMKCHPPRTPQDCQAGLAQAKNLTQRLRKAKYANFKINLMQSEEYFADWLGARAMKAHYSKSRLNSEQLLQELLMSRSQFCPMPKAPMDKHDKQGDFLFDARDHQKQSIEAEDPHPPMFDRITELLESDSFNRLFNCHKSPPQAKAKPNYFDCPKGASK